MGAPAQVQGLIFNSIRTGVDIEVPKMRMQLRLNQFRAAKRAAPSAKIFATQIRDAMVVRRSVALGLPVILVGSRRSDTTDSVTNDYRKLATSLNQHEPVV
jgi:chromosome partitioning protein